MRRGGTVSAVILGIAMLTTVVPMGASALDPLPAVENTIEVTGVSEDGGGAPLSWVATGRTTVNADVPSSPPTRVGNIAVLDRGDLGAPPELALREEISIAQAPIKVSTIREADFRFVVNTHGRTPGGNSYDQGLTLAHDGYFWGNLEQPDPRPIPFGVSCARACGNLAQDGEYRERAFLGTGYALQYPAQANRTPDGEIVLEQHTIDTTIWGREADPSTGEPLEQRMDINYEVIDIAAQGGDVVAEEEMRWGPFRIQPERYDGALSTIFYLKGISDTGLTFTYDVVRNEKGQIHGYDLWLILEEGGRLPETTVADGDVTWGARLVAAAAGFEWPNTTDALPDTPAAQAGTQVPVPSFELPTGEPLPVQAVTAIGDSRHAWTVESGLLPATVTFAGPELRVSGDVGPGAVQAGPAPGEPVPAAFEGTGAARPAIPGHGGQTVAGDAPGLSELRIGDLLVGDVGLPHLVVDGTPHALGTDAHTPDGAWVEELVRPSRTHLNAHWPVFVGNHFVDLYVLVMNRPVEDGELDTSIFLYADPVFSLDSQPHDVEFVWLADTDLGGAEGDRLFRETFDPVSIGRSVANFVYWLATGEEPYPDESGFMRVHEPRETVIRQQDQNEWPIVNDTVDAVDREVLGVISSPITDRVHPDGERSMFYGIRHDGATTPDPLEAVLDQDAFSGGDLALYATTAHRGVQGPTLGHQVFLGVS